MELQRLDVRLGLLTVSELWQTVIRQRRRFITLTGQIDNGRKYGGGGVRPQKANENC